MQVTINPIPSDNHEDDIIASSFRPSRPSTPNNSTDPETPGDQDDVPVDLAQVSSTDSPTLIEPSLMHVLVDRGRSTEVHSISLSPDGERIVTGSEDGCVRMFDLHTGEILMQPQGPGPRQPQEHEAAVWSVMYSPDGSRVVSGSYDSTIIQWDTTLGWLRPLAQTLKTKGGEMGVLTVVYSPDGHRFASATEDATLKIWDATSYTVLRTLQDKSYSGMSLVEAIWAPNGQRIFSYAGETGYIWDAVTGKLLHKLQGHTGMIWQMKLSHVGDRVATGAEDGTCRVWSTETGEELATVMERHAGGLVWSVAFSPDGAYVASGSHDGTVVVRDLNPGGLRHVNSTHEAGVFHLVFSADGKYIFSGGAEGWVDVWDCERKRSVAKMKGHTDKLKAILVSADGRFLYTASDDGSVMVWSLESIPARSSV